MMSKLTLAAVLLSVSAVAFGQATNCNQYNRGSGPFYQYDTNSLDHTDGAHVFNNYVQGSCTYSGTATYSPVGCNVTAQASSGTAGGDIGTIASTGKAHYQSIQDNSGTATANNGAAVSTNALGIIAYDSCYIGLCGIGSISIGYNGATGAISFSKNTLVGR